MNLDLPYKELHGLPDAQRNFERIEDGLSTPPFTLGVIAGFTPGTPAVAGTFTGNNGTTAYTLGDIVNILKLYGLLPR